MIFLADFTPAFELLRTHKEIRVYSHNHRTLCWTGAPILTLLRSQGGEQPRCLISTKSAIHLRLKSTLACPSGGILHQARLGLLFSCGHAHPRGFQVPSLIVLGHLRSGSVLWDLQAVHPLPAVLCLMTSSDLGGPWGTMH